MKTVRVALPGNNALTDTNLDHFSIYSDEDNVLIKEFARGSVGITGNGSDVIETIPHNLGYVPLFFVYVFDTQAVFNNNKWKLLCHNTAGASVPPYLAIADANNLYIHNFLAALAGEIQFKYYIFYDDMEGAGVPEIVESSKVLKVAKSGVDALNSLNPNDYIFHSDLNTFKILKEDNATINYTANGVYSFNHGLSISDPASYMAFMKFPDGKTGLLPGKGSLFSFDSAYFAMESYIDTTQIGFYIGGSATPNTFYVKYYIFETPLA